MSINHEDLQFDRDHIWHPYTSMLNPLRVYPVESARGVNLTLSDGRILVDGMSSWWCAIHGYNHPKLNDAISQQIKKMSHIMFGGLTHEPAISLVRTLIDRAPDGLDKVFLADSGSVATEVAIKMAIQYHKSIGHNKKTRLATVRGGYYGDTTGAMALCDPTTGMHRFFQGMLMEQIFLPAPPAQNIPWDPNCLNHLESTLKEQKDQLAAFIIEPIVQGAGGMRFYHPEYLKVLREFCTTWDILLIFDEIATGFGRSGKFFASEWAEVSPDIMTCGKALTAGYMTLSAVLCSGLIAQSLSRKGLPFMHGPTFMGNPLACAVANANLKILHNNHWQEQVQRVEHGLKKGLAPAKHYEHVVDVRVLGAIGVIETRAPVNIERMQEEFVNAGVWIRPFGRLCYLMPPYIINEPALAKLCSVLVETVARHGKT